MPYPTEITQEMLPRFIDISDEELANDIAATEEELKYLDLQLQGLRLLMKAYQGLEAYDEVRTASLAIDDANMRMIDAGQFIAFLKALQEARKNDFRL